MYNIAFHCSEKENFSDGYSASAFTYTDYSIALHTHDFYEINIVLGGTGTHRISSGSFEVVAGDVFVIPPSVAHAYIDTTNLEVYHVLLKKSFIDENREETEKVDGFLAFTEIEPLLRSNFSESLFLHLNSLQSEQVKNDILILDNNGSYPWEKYSLMKYHTVWKMLYWFSALLSEQLKNEKNPSNEKYKMQIISALEYIHKNYSEKITVDTLCKITYLSRSTFQRSFKEICGVPPMEYLNKYRCERAMKLSETSSASKTEIAHSCGFYDLSHMERMIAKFKNNGMTKIRQ